MAKKIVLATLILLSLGGAGFYGWRWSQQKTKGPAYKPVKVTKGDLSLSVLASGTVQPENRLIIKPSINGRIDEILVVEGTPVKKGQILAWMSSTDRAALLDAARAKGPEEIAYWESLYRPAPIIAPLDGIIILKAIEPGQTVGTNDTTFVMSNHLIVVAQVDETDMRQISVGQKAIITLDSYSQYNIDASVKQIALEAKNINNVTIYDVRLAPRKVPPYMRSGMTANASFLVDSKKDVLLLPLAAVKQKGKVGTVMLPKPTQEDEDALEPKEVTLGLSDGKTIEIVDGLAEGDTVMMVKVAIPDGSEKAGSPFSPFGGGGRKGK